ncbi:MAG: peptidylprolyl isomerase [Bacteroidetes bacterium]|nr:peptidylprolyl isomerase [Bacteroidota bacterium]
MSKFTSRLVLVSGLLIMGLNSQAQPSGSKVIDRIVAQIGEEIILLSDIQNRRLEIIQEGQSLDVTTDCMILEEMLFEKLLINQAQIDSVEIPDDMVNSEMEGRIRYIASQIGSIEELEKFYGKSVAQIKAEFFNLIKKRMMAERMRDIITENVVITPNEVREFYNNLPKDSLPYINSKISVAQIVLYPKLTEDDKAKAKKNLEFRRSQIISGDRSFEGVATLESKDPGSRLTGGDLGWNSRGTMVPEFEAELFKLDPMGISPVFETQYGYHIVQLIERKGDNYHCRHILFMPEVSDKALMKSAATIDSLYAQIKKGTITFEDAAIRFSEDENSKQNGGKIVNPYTGDYFWDIQNINDIDPQMSRIVQSLKVGDYSSPSLYDNMMEQKQGIRMVKLLDRTKPHVANLKDDYQLIQMAALNEKKQTVIDKWVRDKIGGAYVHIFDKDFISQCTYRYPWIATGS